MKTINRSDLHLHYKADTGCTVDEELYDPLLNPDIGYVEWLEEKLLNLARAMENPYPEYKTPAQICMDRFIRAMEEKPESLGLEKVYENKHLYLLRKRDEK